MNATTDLSQFKVKGIPCPMVGVKGEHFEMQLEDYFTDNKTFTASVNVPDFFMAKYPVTQALYEGIMKKNPSHFRGKQRPVEQVSWREAWQFIEKLNEETGMSFRLPFEAEWAYAAVGGSKEHSQGYAYCGSDDLKQVGWYRDNSGEETKPVGLLLPNELGLYDMSGNVWEWCEDDWHYSKDFTDAGRPRDGSAWVDGATTDTRGAGRVVRGGSYFYDPTRCRPSFRSSYRPGRSVSYVGFRLVLSLQSGSHIP